MAQHSFIQLNNELKTTRIFVQEYLSSYVNKSMYTYILVHTHDSITTLASCAHAQLKMQTCRTFDGDISIHVETTI